MKLTAIASILLVMLSGRSFGQTAPPGPNEIRRLSVDEAARLALEQNLGIAIQRFNPQIQDVGIAEAVTPWLPQLSTSLSRNSQTQAATNAFAGGTTSVDNGQLSTSVG